MKKLFLATFFALSLYGLFIYGAKVASACTAIYMAPEERLKNADVVFFGTAKNVETKISSSTIGLLIDDRISVTTFQVSKYFKGSGWDTAWVKSSFPVGFSCGPTTGQVGVDYLVYVNYSTSTSAYSFIGSSGLVRASSTDPVVVSLGEGKPPQVLIQLPTLPTPKPNTSYIFTRNLSAGASGEDVRSLQKYLNSRGFTVSVSGAGSTGNETTFFGPATRVALIKFQKANNINPAVGYFGPLTRANVNSSQ